MKTFTRLLATFSILLGLFSVLPYLSWDLGTSAADLPAVKEVNQRATVIGYDRDAMFGGWLTGVREGVVAQAGTIDPYSGAPLDLNNAEVDHIFPLSAAWDLGAHSWTAAQRITFANDPINLVLVSREQNQTKGDQLPSEWLPQNPRVRCWYVEKLFGVANAYHLPLPAADVRIAQKQCGFAKF
ncbi:GmrSD restriction endonuclease domain-containing protein [Corynebacterium callunae]|uniref:GmrSD restriction endonuclease domain-containing protein n=1 Tax=Corynebacterium callunae TaxID=1721 RepID=UPI0004A4DD0A|nr:DUF1524 domain-containing protein [Corynebacterium callunae]